MPMSISFRTYLSISHLLAASIFANKSKLIEDEYKFDTISQSEKHEHQAFVVSSIIMSAAFLEATINEIFSDCLESNTDERIKKIPNHSLMARLWELKIPRTASYSILEKYQIALELNNLAQIESGSQPFQDAKLLIELRNALIHFEPETIKSTALEEKADPHKFEKRFSGKVSSSKVTGPGNPFYPDKLLGVDCAIWAVKSAINFADEFFNRISIESTYNHVKAEVLKNING